MQDTDYNIIKVNKVVEQTFGKVALGRKCYEAYQGRDHICPDCPVDKVLATGEPAYSAEQWGSAKPVVEIWAFPMKDEQGNIVAVIEHGKDITERKRVGERLEESEKRLRSIVETATDAIISIDSRANIILWNRAAETIYGYSADEAVGKPLTLIIPERFRQDFQREMEQAISTGKSDILRKTIELPGLRKDGTEFSAELSATAWETKQGRFFTAISRDITERKQAEEALRESEERFRELANSLPVMVLDQDDKGNIKYLNRAGLDMLGYTQDDLDKGLSLFQIIVPEELDRVREEFKRALKGEERGIYENRILRKDGSTFLAEVRLSPIFRDKKIVGFRGISIDITERKRAEEKEKQLQDKLNLSSRLASIGELAAGVAHEINNPLTGIIGFSERLLRKSADETIRRDLERIHNEGQRAAKVIENLLTFARHREPKKEYSDINDTVQKALELRVYELKMGNIEVVTDLAPNLPQILGDFQQLEELFLNIMLNAEQAIVEANRRGKLVIKTQQIKGYIRISFTDDGPGIPAEHRSKLFDPFFTTRGERGGTGLGLSICHGIVAEHGGKIYARNKLGKGTTFFVELPLTTKKIDRSKVVETEPARGSK